MRVKQLGTLARRSSLTSAIILASVGFGVVATADDDEICNQGACEMSWATISEEREREISEYAEGYKTFMMQARTELTTVSGTIDVLKRAGFSQMQDGQKVNPGDKYYHLNRDRALTIIVGGKAPAREGVRIVASHIDSPRLA